MKYKMKIRLPLWTVVEAEGCTLDEAYYAALNKTDSYCFSDWDSDEPRLEWVKKEDGSLVPLAHQGSATPSVTDQRYDQLWSFIGEANKPEELTEFGQGIRTAFEYMCEENATEDIYKYWDEIKAKSYKKKKYSVEVERRIFYSLEVEATNETEAENLATEESAKLAAIKPDSGWYIDDSQDDEVRFCEEIK